LPAAPHPIEMVDKERLAEAIQRFMF